MEAKVILEKAKVFFNDLFNTPPAPPAAPAAPAAPGEYDLKDGGKVMIDKLEAGGIVMIDGNPALPGDLELADGTKITVADNGVIAAIAPGAPAAPAAPPNFESQFAEFKTLAETKFTEYEQNFNTYKEASEAKFTEYEVKLGKANKVIDQLLQLSQVLVDKPAAAPDPSVTTKNIFKSQEEIQKEEKQQALEKQLNTVFA